MSLTVKLDLPPDIEERLRLDTPDLDADVRDAYAIELFRRGRLNHLELSKVLGLDRLETDARLKRHGVFEGSLTMKDLEADRRTLDHLFAKDR